MKKLMLLMVLFGSMSYLTSCSINDDQIPTTEFDNPIYATGGEIDDPVEPDREDN